MMTIDVGTYLVVSLMFAVFAAVAAVGTSLVLGVGFERLRNGFEVVRKQTAFFSDAIYKLDIQAGELDERTRMLEATTVTLGARTDALEEAQNRIVEDMQERAEHHINAGKAEALVRHAEDLLIQATHTARMAKEEKAEETCILHQVEKGKSRKQQSSFAIPKSLAAHVILGGEEGNQIRFV